MHYSTKRRVALGMTTGGLLMTGFGVASAHADTSAAGNTTRSPGVGSGNLIQLPINAPINVCGNQLDVIGILDSVTGNSCANSGGSHHGPGATSSSGSATGSPGVGSGNLIQVPINAPINICGNQVDVIGIGDSDHGNSCANHGGGSTTASGGSSGSPGIVAGNVLQVPINAPLNVCGNQVDVVGLLNSVTGNSCANNGHGGKPPQPSPTPTPPTPAPTPTPTPTGPSCGCPPPPPPPPPTTPCPPSGTSTPTPTAPGSTPTTTPSSSASGGGSAGGGSHGGSTSGRSGGSSGKSTGVLAHTGSGVLAAAPFGAGLLGGGVLLRKRFAGRSH